MKVISPAHVGYSMFLPSHSWGSPVSLLIGIYLSFFDLYSSSKSSRSSLLLLKVFLFPPFLLLLIMIMITNTETIARIITTGITIDDNSPYPRNPPDSVDESDFGV